MNLKEWRKGKKLTQGELAEKLGLVENTYQAYESGRIGIPEEIRAKFKKMGFAGPFPEEADRPVTVRELESLREEVRVQAAWVREELRKDIEAAIAGLLASQERDEER